MPSGKQAGVPVDGHHASGFRIQAIMPENADRTQMNRRIHLLMLTQAVQHEHTGDVTCRTGIPAVK